MSPQSVVWRFALFFAFVVGAIPFASGKVPEKQPDIYRIAVIGGIRQKEPAPALERYVQADPDLCIWVGDNMYADTYDDPDYLTACYRQLASKPGFEQLRKNVPFAVTWDDHDYGANNTGRTYPLKEESRRRFIDFWGMKEHIPDDRPGIYHTRYFDADSRRLQVILLDVRTWRDEPDTDGDILGEAQWDWLDVQLREQADLRLIVSGTQILLDAESGSETWENYPASLNRLFETVRRSAAEGVVFITGDQHYAEVCRLEGAIDTDAIELEFCGVNQTEGPEFNRYRIAPAAQAKHKYALIDVQFETNRFDIPHLLFRVFRSKDDGVEVIYRVNLDELSFEINFEGPTNFLDQGSIRLTHRHPLLVSRYTTDGSSPTADSLRYDGPIRIDSTTQVSAALFSRNGDRRGAIHSQEYRKMQATPSVVVKPNRLTTGLRYQYYEGDFKEIPRFEDLASLRSGVSETLDVVALAARKDHFAILFDGYVEVPRTGIYTFHTRSDDGSRLWIHDKLVVENDGSHSTRTRSGQIVLEAGLHPIRLEYFEDYLGEILELGWKLPGGEHGSTVDRSIQITCKKSK